jgi:hypothetical protein
LVVLPACATEVADPTAQSGDSALFGVGVTTVALTVMDGYTAAKAGPKGSPVCFAVNAYEPTSIFDIAGSHILQDYTEQPLVFLPKGSFAGVDRDYVGVGPLCLGEDHFIYATVKEYIAPTQIAKDLNEERIATPIRTQGPEHVFRIGRGIGGWVTEPTTRGQRVAQKNDVVFDDFDLTFRMMMSGGSDDIVAGPKQTFVFTPKKNTTVTDFETRPPSIVKSED